MLFFSVTAPVLVSDSEILLFNTSKICLYLYFSSTNNSKNLGAFSHDFTMFYINFTIMLRKTVFIPRLSIIRLKTYSERVRNMCSAHIFKVAII